MNYSKEICKVTDNQIVFPIKDYENIGDSLSSINYNFNALDVYTCNFEYSANNIWNQMYNTFSNNSATWNSYINTVTTTSAAWNDTYTVVSQLSSIWLKPISLIYPYPFADNTNIAGDISVWLNDNFPVVSNLCSNFVIGQELYIFTPLYNETERIFSKSLTVGKKQVVATVINCCIGHGCVPYKFAPQMVDCKGFRFTTTLPDMFISTIEALKFIIDPDTLTWRCESTLYN